MTGYSILRDARGAPIAVTMTFEEYLRLDPTGAESYLTDEQLGELAANEADGEFFPSDVVHRILDGENPIRVFREHRGHTQGELADLAEVSSNYVSMIETGKVRPSRKLQLKLAAVLNVDYEDLEPATDEDE
jgi:DNA-binding XRE family transcriptional regulator